MRELVIRNIPVRLNEQDFQQLLRRFNPDKVKEVGDIHLLCICHTYNDACDRCPFRILEPLVKHASYAPCTAAIEEIKKQLGDSLGFSLGKRFIDIYDEDRAKKVMGKVRENLLKLPRLP